MRIVNGEEFLALPNGTIFQILDYVESDVGNLFAIKGNSNLAESAYSYSTILGPIKGFDGFDGLDDVHAGTRGTGLWRPIFDQTATTHSEALFVVWSKRDVTLLTGTFMALIEKYPGTLLGE